jgi:hypothetical protein
VLVVDFFARSEKEPNEESSTGYLLEKMKIEEARSNQLYLLLCLLDAWCNTTVHTRKLSTCNDIDITTTQ